MHVAAGPVGKTAFARQCLRVLHRQRIELLIMRTREARFDAADFSGGQLARTVFQMRPFGIDLFAEFFRRQFLHQNLDACLVFVVAAAEAVVDA